MSAFDPDEYDPDDRGPDDYDAGGPDPWDVGEEQSHEMFLAGAYDDVAPDLLALERRLEPRVEEPEPPAIVWAPPCPDCYSCLGTGWQVGFGARRRTVVCSCTTHSRDCDPESCDASCPTRKAELAGHI